MYNILYAEDDTDSRTLMCLLQRISPDLFRVTLFEDSSDFENRLLHLDPQPDLVLLDIHIKPYSGFDMLKIIRSHPTYDNTPVVAITASVMNIEVQLLKRAGFSGVLAKPLHMDEFADLVRRIMAKEAIWYVW